MKRVVIVQEYIPTYRKQFFEELTRLALAQAIEVEVIAGLPLGKQSERADAELIIGPPIRQYELRFRGRRLVFRRIRSRISGADLVICEQARRNIDLYFLLFNGQRSFQIALWGHGKDYVRRSSRLDRFLQKLITLKADWFFAYTPEGARAVEGLGFPGERVTVVRNAIDTAGIAREMESVTLQDVHDFRAAHGLTTNTAVFIGGLDSSKRVPFLLEAASRAHKIDPSFRLLIIGDGSDRPLVEQAVQDPSGVIFTGPLTGKQKTIALMAGKVIAMPGRVGLVAVDSFAVGRPVITADWPWHAPEFDYLNDGIDSLVTADDPGIFAEEMVALMKDGDRLKTLQAACLSKAKLYSIETMAERYLDGIVELLRKDTKV